MKILRFNVVAWTLNSIVKCSIHIFNEKKPSYVEISYEEAGKDQHAIFHILIVHADEMALQPYYYIHRDVL